MGLPEDDVGFAFAIMGAGFSFGAPLAGYLCGKIPKTFLL